MKSSASSLGFKTVSNVFLNFDLNEFDLLSIFKKNRRLEANANGSGKKIMTDFDETAINMEKEENMEKESTLAQYLQIMIIDFINPVVQNYAYGYTIDVRNKII
ncbi:unnamed protein product [Lactuca saligna]|uniref:Uncharacterized protein n=1 Tax=Lactuca saligna TaxID=75948 RepID=A0AA36E9R3_LACSI|nr:unnamed protein product [Lactuca saligna]